MSTKGQIIAAMSSDEEDNGNAAEPMDLAQRVSMDEDSSDDDSSDGSGDEGAGAGTQGASSAMDQGSDEDQGPSEEEAMGLVEAALQEVAGPNPSYEHLSKCVETLRGVAHSLRKPHSQTAVLHKLRQVREQWCVSHCLPPDAWLAWVRDEATLPGGSQALQVLERGVSECPSCLPLRLAHLAYLHDTLDGKEPSLDHNTKDRELRGAYEKAVTAAGTHILDGHKVWDAYRVFEQGVCERVLSDASATDKDKTKARDRVAQLIKRQASLPLVKNAEAIAVQWSAFLQPLSDKDRQAYDRGLGHTITTLHKDATHMLSSRLPLESLLCPSASHGGSTLNKPLTKPAKQDAWTQYIQLELKEGQVGRAVQVAERAVQDCYWAEKLWLLYIDVLTKQLKNTKAATQVCERGVKCCAWSLQLWSRLLRLQERDLTPHGNTTLSNIDNTATRALEGVLGQKPEDCLALLIAHADIHRRHTLHKASNAAHSGEGLSEVEACVASLKGCLAYMHTWLDAAFPPPNAWDAASLQLTLYETSAYWDVCVVVKKVAALSPLAQSLEASCRSAWEEALGHKDKDKKEAPLAQYYQAWVGYVSWLRQVDVSQALQAAKHAAIATRTTQAQANKQQDHEEEDDDKAAAYTLGAVKDYPEGALQLWCDVEREVGTVDGYEAALSTLTSLQQQQQTQPVAPSSAPSLPPPMPSSSSAPRDRKRKQADKPKDKSSSSSAQAEEREGGPSSKRPKPQPAQPPSSEDKAKGEEAKEQEGGEEKEKKTEEHAERFFVFIKHLGGKVYERDLRASLESLLGGPENVLRVLVSTDIKTKKPKGSAVVQLASPQVQQQAIALSGGGLVVRGRTLEVLHYKSKDEREAAPTPTPTAAYKPAPAGGGSVTAFAPRVLRQPGRGGRGGEGRGGRGRGPAPPTDHTPAAVAEGGDKPKSNQDFRAMLGLDKK